MSSLTADEIREININRYLKLIPYAILLHEYCLTFALEVERFWRRKIYTWAAFFFFLNRYLVLLGHVPVIFRDFWYSTAHNKLKICRDLRLFHEYHVVAVQIVVAAMLILRTYALYNQSRQILAVTIGVVLVAVAVACWGIVSGAVGSTEKSIEYFVVTGCATLHSRSGGLRLAKSWGALLAFDTLIFALTVYKSIALHVGGVSSLFALMLRDGSVYFGVMVASNVANILTYVYGGSFTKGVATAFVNIISSVMITRLMLNMRDPRLSTDTEGYQMTTIGFHHPGIFSTLVNPTTEVDEGSRRQDHRENCGSPPTQHV